MTEATVPCGGCGKEVFAGGIFPGGSVRCSCGVETPVPAARPAHGASKTSAPYRAPSERTSEVGMLTCPFCGGPCAADVRACPHCDVELASTRCGRCYALHFSGARFCARCGEELQLEPLLDATDAPCPRCSRPLSQVAGGAPEGFDAQSLMHECLACGGLFLDRRALEKVMERQEAAPHPPRAGFEPRVPAVEEVRYLQCPLCHVPMNRVNFGKRSGVIVDVCKPHGTWFDRGELTRAIEFVAGGGVAEGSLRDARDAKAHEAEIQKVTATMQTDLVADAVAEGRKAGYWQGRWGERHTTLLDILYEVLK